MGEKGGGDGWLQGEGRRDNNKTGQGRGEPRHPGAAPPMNYLNKSSWELRIRHRWGAADKEGGGVRV